MISKEEFEKMWGEKRYEYMRIGQSGIQDLYDLLVGEGILKDDVEALIKETTE